jgi:hypothetical protein
MTSDVEALKVELFANRSILYKGLPNTSLNVYMEAKMIIETHDAFPSSCLDYFYANLSPEERRQVDVMNIIT